jgi:SAM-dependent methyltransferase
MPRAQDADTVVGMDTDHVHDHRGHHSHHDTDTDTDTDQSAMAELLDLDGEVLHDYLSEVTGWIEAIAADAPPRRILDIGAGTGTGTFALLHRFEGADAVAVDLSPQLLEHLRASAERLGLADRVRTVEADLDAGWPAIDTADLIWASASLHHMADPDRVLRDIFDTLRPGGLMVLVELESFPRFLPDDIGIGRPGLEARAHAVLDERRAAGLPAIGSDWGSRLSQAGFVIQAERAFSIELTRPLPDATGRYAEVSLRRMRPSLAGHLSDDDLAAFDTLLDGDGPLGILRRDDLNVRAGRSSWIARRP